MKKQNKQDKQDSGFVYRGNYRELSLGGKRIRLVPHETYVTPFLQDPSNVEVELRNEIRSIRLKITASEYYEYLSVGRLTFKDLDPYV